MKKIIFFVCVAVTVFLAWGDFPKNVGDQDREIQEYIQEMRKETANAINAIENEKSGSTVNRVLLAQASDYSLALSQVVNYIQKLMLVHPLSWTNEVVIEVNLILKRLVQFSYFLQNVIIAEEDLIKSYFKAAVQSATNEMEKLMEIAHKAQDSYVGFILKQDIKGMFYYYASITGKIPTTLNAQIKATQDIYKEIQDVTNDVINDVKKMKEGVKDVPDYVMFLGMQITESIVWLQYWVNWDQAETNTGAKTTVQDITMKMIDANQHIVDLSTAMSYTNDTKNFNEELINTIKATVTQMERFLKVAEIARDDLLAVGVMRGAMINLLSSMQDLKRELSIST